MTICNVCKNTIIQKRKRDYTNDIIVKTMCIYDCPILGVLECSRFIEKPKREYIKEMIETETDVEQLKKNREKEIKRSQS